MLNWFWIGKNGINLKSKNPKWKLTDNNIDWLLDIGTFKKLIRFVDDCKKEKGIA